MTTSNPSDILSIENLSIGYGSRTVASHLSATLRAGCLTCLVGRNGVGKSTLLKTLSGFLPPLSGTVCISGRDASALTGRERARLVSVVLTGRPEVRMLTVEETVALGRTPYTNLWGRLTAHDTAVIDTMVGPKYKQHSPEFADGKQAFKDGVSGFLKAYPDSTAVIKHIGADGDLVFIHNHIKLNKEDRGQAAVDIFRIKDGKIVEHWDVIQDIPEKAANDNTMF